MYSPLISVIIPVYKVEQYLRRCLDSIVNQTYTNLEIILVDDGSPDNSPQICDEFANKDNRIAVIHKKNGGLSDARNAGLDICKGEYISFVDSDDWVSQEYINKLYSSITKSHADIAIVNHTLVNDFCTPKCDKKPSVKIFTKQQALFKLIAKQYQPFVVSWGKLYRKELFKSIRFPVGKYHEDEFTSHFLLYAASKITFSPNILYFYYQRPNSITKQNHLADAIAAFENRLDFAINNKLNNLTPYAASNLCWKYLNLCYEKYLSNEDYSHPLHKAEKIKSLMRLKQITDLFLFIFIKHPTLYFFIKKHKC